MNNVHFRFSVVVFESVTFFGDALFTMRLRKEELFPSFASLVSCTGASPLLLSFVSGLILELLILFMIVLARSLLSIGVPVELLDATRKLP